MNTSSGGYDPAHFARLFELEEKSFWFRGRSDLINWALDRYFPTAGSFLEIGCGNGYVLDRIRRAHPEWRLVGAELFQEGLDLARRRLPQDVELRQLDAVRMPYSGSFDVVGAFDVLEHIGPDDEALAGIFRALRPGGGLVVTVPQHKWLWSDADVAARHVRRYTRDELIARLTAAGFTVERVTSFVSLLLPAMVASRLLGNGGNDVEAELDVPTPVNHLGYATMRVEAALLRSGVGFPAGGSLLAVARRPD
jgi:SAM-dependent methyltransferase